MHLIEYTDFFGNKTGWYSYLVGAGLIVIFLWMMWTIRRFRLERKEENELVQVFPFMLLFATLSAFLIDALFTGDWRTWFGSGVRRFGFTYTGWVFGALVFLPLYGRRTDLGGRFLLNCFLPSFALSQAIGRVGCFLGGCCYGCPCSWGLSYPPGSLPYLAVGSTPLFPVQLVEAAALTVLFFLCWAFAFRFRAGVYLIGVAIVRFVLEFFRFDPRGSLLGQDLLSPQQVMSILFLAVGVYLLASAARTRTPVPLATSTAI